MKVLPRFDRRSDSAAILLLLVLAFLVEPLLNRGGAQNMITKNQSVGRRWALIVCVDRYVDSSFVPRPGASLRGKQISNVLKQIYGYTEDNIIGLYNDAATGRQVSEQLSRMRRVSGPGDTFFAYFGVHTLRDTRVPANYFVPFDGSSNDAWTLVSEALLRQYLDSLSSSFLVVEDCYQTSAPQDRILKKRPDYLSQQSNRRSGAFQVMAHCGPDERGYTDRFSEFLIRGLTGDAADSRCAVTASGLRTYMAERYVRSVSMPRDPIAFESYGSDFTFNRPYPAPIINLCVEQQLEDARNSVAVRTRALDDLVNTVVSQRPNVQHSLSTHLMPLLRTVVDDSTSAKALRYSAIRAMGQLRKEESVELLIKLVETSSDPSSRQAALEALVKVDSALALPYVRRSLNDADPGVRISAVRAWTGMHDETKERVLAEFLKTEPDSIVRVEALVSLPTFTPPSNVIWKTLDSMLSNPDPEIRREVVDALARLEESRSTPRIADLLRRDQNGSVRQSSGYALGRLFTESNRILIEDALIDALKYDQQDEVQEAAAYSLGKFPNSRGGEVLADALGRQSPIVRQAAAYALGSLKYPGAVKKLIKLLAKDEVPEIRLTAAIALGQIGDRKAANPLLKALKDENSNVRSAAEEALHQIGGGPVDRNVVEALEDDNPKVRLEAVRQLGKGGDPSVVPSLVNMLADDEYGVRQNAIRELSNFPDEASTRPILEALKDDNFLKRQGAASVLASTRAHSSLEPLLEHVGETNSAVRAEVIRALGAIGAYDDERVVIAIVRATRDDDPTVRNVAINALSTSTHPRAKREWEVAKNWKSLD